MIQNLSFEVNPGESLAIVGATGAGKSTIINLLPRFYDPQEGSIEIDGQNIRDVSLESLRKNLSMVSQDVILFDDINFIFSWPAMLIKLSLISSKGK